MDMEYVNNNTEAFFSLLKTGLWEKNITLSSPKKIDFAEVYRLAEEQSVLGVILAGLEHSDVKPPQELLLQWIGNVQILEQTNKAMNAFLADLVENMRREDIYTLLVKGQGIAQCYERPLWRASGDVDFYLSDANFAKAKTYFRPLVDTFDPDNEYTKHINMHYGEWVVEIHGNQYCSLSKSVNRVMDEIHCDLFCSGKVRNWLNGNTLIFLPSVDNDVLIIFIHFLNHFYKGGIGLRQICDWCRLLWTYKDSLNLGLLESRIRKMGLMSEWKAFGAFAVDYLGMPSEAMPMYSANARWKKKAYKICSFILEVGNMGHNRDTSYFEKYPYLIRKVCSMWRRCGDLIHHAQIFPLDSLRFFPRIMFNGMRSAMRGE